MESTWFCFVNLRVSLYDQFRSPVFARSELIIKTGLAPYRHPGEISYLGEGQRIQVLLFQISILTQIFLGYFDHWPGPLHLPGYLD
jgi:hypothetical protein